MPDAGGGRPTRPLNVQVTKMKLSTTTISCCVLGLLLLACDRQVPSPPVADAQMRKITIAETGVSPPALLLYIARDQGYYVDEGLTVEFTTRFGYGKANIQAVMEGKADICTASETPVMRAGLADQPVRVLATIGSAERHMAVVGRLDRGIETLGDLADKRLGVTVGSNAEYFFDAFLQMRGLPDIKVEKTHFAPTALAGALEQGEVDAIVSWFPNWMRAQNLLGSNAQRFFGDGFYSVFMNLLVNDRFVSERPAEAAAFLRALVRAEQFARDHPDAALAAFQKQLKLSEAVAKDVFPNYHLRVRLGQELLLTLEDQARWVIRKGLTDRADLPNYLHYVHTEPLASVAPAAVTIIR